MEGGPRVGIVVVSYNRRDLTLRCLAHLRQLTWPADRLRVVVVDNASSDGSVAAVREQWPDVDVVETGANLGFGGACNRGFARLHDVDYVALVNNDAVPDPGWIEPLVDALEREPRAGAATPKVLLSGDRFEVQLVAGAVRVERDPRLLGVQVGQVCVGDDDVTGDVEWAEGFFAPETSDTGLHHYRWTSERATMLVPARSSGEITIELAVPGGAPRSVEIRCGGERTDLSVGTYERVRLRAPSTGVRVINNAGAVVLDDGSLADRGFLEIDSGQYDAHGEVEAWSGAAVLLRRAYIDDVGGFDEPLFLYYEDADLSWRGRNRGWRYVYVPTSVVHHDHSATTRTMGGLVRHLSTRNRLVVLTKVAPRPVVVRAWTTFLRQLGAAISRDVLLRALSRERPVTDHVAAMLRVLIGALRMTPRALVLRRTARPRRYAERRR